MAKIDKTEVIEAIEKLKGTNIRALCRYMNGVETTEVCNNSQFNGSQCKKCRVNYPYLITVVHRLSAKKLIYTEAMRLVDLDKFGKIVTNKRADNFTMCAPNKEALLESYHLKNTLLPFLQKGE
jgi:hypothetical protein